MKNNLLKVNFFGEFSLHYKGETILVGYARKNKVLKLLQYLLVNRGATFSKESLMDLIYEEGETENTANALKIIIHRLRRQLIEVGLPDQEYIENKSGRYGWNIQIPCELDTESFNSAIKKADNPSLTDEKRLESYLKAIEIYKGDFLGYNSAEEWIIPLRVYYQEIYIKTLKKSCDILKKMQDFDRMLKITTAASLLYPYNEEVLAEKIYCLNAMGKIKEALHEYNSAVDLIFNEFGVTPSPELVEVFDTIMQSPDNISESILDAKRFLDNLEEEEGAYYCNLQNFADSYRFLVRGFERSGISAFLMLCTIVNKQGKPLEDEKLLKEAASVLKIETKRALRRGDLYTRYSTAQFLFLLIGINQENCALVFQRIENNFNKKLKGKAVDLHYKVISAADIDKFFKE